MLKDPIVVRSIGLLLVLGAIFFGKIWWRHFNKYVQNDSAKPFKDAFVYGLSFIFIMMGFLGIGLIYFGRFQ